MKETFDSIMKAYAEYKENPFRFLSFCLLCALVGSLYVNYLQSQDLKDEQESHISDIKLMSNALTALERKNLEAQQSKTKKTRKNAK